MGLLDTISKIGFAVEDAFTPTRQRIENQLLRETLLQEKLKREKQEQMQNTLGLLGETLFPDIPDTVSPAGVQANAALLRTAQSSPETSLDVGQSGLDVLSGASGARNAGNFLPDGGVVPGVDRSRERNLLGLLSTIAPEATAQAAIGSLFPSEERSEPSDIRTLRAIGIDPMSPEGRKIILGRMQDSGYDDALIKRVELQLKSLELTEKERERVEREDTAEQQRMGLKLGIEDDIRNALDLAELNKELGPLVDRTGTSFGDFLAQAKQDISAILGNDTDRAVSLRNTFKKKQANFLINSIPRIQGNRVLNSQFSVLQSATGGLGVDTVTNNQVIADSLDALLDSARISGIPIEDVTGGRSEAEMKAIIEELRSGLFRKPLPEIFK